MLGQAGQRGIDAHVTGTSRGVIKQACSRRRPLEALGPPVVVEELHQTSISPGKTAALVQLISGVARGLGSGP